MTNINPPAGAPVNNQTTAGAPAAGMPTAGMPVGNPFQLGVGQPMMGQPMAGQPMGGQQLIMPGQPVPMFSGTAAAPVGAPAPFMDQSMSLFGQLPGQGNGANSINSNTSANTIVIRRITLVEAKRQQVQRSRNYVPMVDNTTLKILNNFRDAVPDMSTTAADIVRMQGQGASFFQTSAQPGAVVNIENGWGNRRFTFTITADVYFNGVLYCTEYLAGYTDHHGVSNLMGGQTLDPDMVFVITSMTRSAPRPIQGTTTTAHTVNNASLVVAPSHTPGFTGPNQIRLARPRDVFAELSVLPSRMAAESLAGMPATLTGGQSYLNMNTTVGNTPRLSNVNNNVASIYAATVLTAAGQGFANPSESQNPYTLARSSASAGELEYGASHFVHMLSEKFGGFQGMLANTFTLRNLYSVDTALQSDADQRIVVMPSDIFAREITRTSSGQAITVPAGDSCDSFDGTGSDVANAITIMFAATAAFRRAGISYITCRLTNYSGVDNYAITSLFGVDDGLLGKRASDACTSIIRETVLGITRNSESYQIDLVVDINNDAYVKIARGMLGEREFVMPCFALASMSPIVGNQNTLDTLVTGVKNINDELFKDTMVIGDFGSFNHNSVSY